MLDYYFKRFNLIYDSYYLFIENQFWYFLTNGMEI